ncbi:Fc receptor-like protein 5 [Fundulus heteroclitus]|uniref:Fc receptor-like protein 5 n=1 Tax=Fundulus heteroclitus TaxID=8078 RepID=UPI00165AABE9|nr:Fc receptor-like protein 5 [Fundulus heteroclitus]
MENALLCMLAFFLLSALIYDHANAAQTEPGRRAGAVKDSITASVSLQPNWSEIFRGETVTLRCEIQGGGGAQWTYEWSSANRNSPSSSEYRIISVSESDSGDYSCMGRRCCECTGWSSAFRLTVRSDKPRATLTAEKTILPAGGSVALRCSVSSSAGWKFDWFRQESVSSLAQLIRTNEPDGVLRVSEGGVYSCRGGRGDPAFYTETSTEVTIQETVSIKPTVTLQPNWSEIFRGETVTLRCEIQGCGGAQWTYGWSPTTRNSPSSSEYRINSITESDSGDYWCTGRRGYQITEWSDAFRLTVRSDKPRASLSPEKTILPAGGSVALRCSVSSSAGWKYDWFRQESVSSPAHLIRTNEPDGVLRVSEGGVYSCRGGRGDPAFYTETSTEVTIQETVSIKPTVTLQPNWSEIFRGETVTLRCEIQGVGGTQWTYEWRPTTRNSPSSSEYRIISITESDSGDYWCMGRRGYQITGWSDAFRLTVRSDKPRARLTANRPIIPAGGSVALRCSVSSSAGWKFDWFRQESVSSLAQLIRTNEPDGVLRVSEGGVYSCRGGRGDPAFYTETSTEVTIQETGEFSF